jgi:hypothetical protein
MIDLYEWLGIASFLWSKINDDLADVVNGFIREGINDEKYSEIMKYIARPEKVACQWSVVLPGYSGFFHH